MRHSPIINVLMVLLAAVAVVRTQTSTQQAPSPAPSGRGVTPSAPTVAGRGAPSPPTPVRTGVIRGRVVAADTGAPLRRAQVRFGTTAGARGGGVTGTDDQGRFEITGLPAGTYDVNASKTGFVTLSYGQNTPAEGSRQIELADAQVAADINFSLPRGSVIVATITDAYGEPLTGARVDVMQYRLQGGQRRLVSVQAGAETNDLGQARVYGLLPGQYVVRSGAPPGLAAAGRNMGYAPTFHPGTTDARDAQRVALGLGQEAIVAFSLAPVKLATVSGTIRRADGTPIGVPLPQPGPPPAPGTTRFSVALRQDVSGPGLAYSIATMQDGRFSVTNVLPGNYLLEVRPGAPIMVTQDGIDRGYQQTPESLARSVEYARVPVTVAGEDITNLDVTTQKGATISGQLIFDTGRTPRDKSPSEFGVIVYYTGSEPPLSPGTGEMKDDFSFTISGVVATGIIRLASTTTGWYTKSVVIDGKEVVQTPMEFEPGRDYRNVQLTLTQKRSEVNGGAIDSRGRAVTDYTVLLFPEEREWWYPRSRVTFTVRPDQKGQFKIPALPDGTYFIAALPSLEQGADQDAETLAQIAPKATKVTLREGETKTMSLTLQESR